MLPCLNTVLILYILVSHSLNLMSFLELSFTWIFNQYPSFIIEDTRRFVSQKNGNLYIAKVEPSDVGNYTCVVTNTVTKSSVQGPPTPLVLRHDGTITPPQYTVSLFTLYNTCILFWHSSSAVTFSGPVKLFGLFFSRLQVWWVNTSQKSRFSSLKLSLSLRALLSHWNVLHLGSMCFIFLAINRLFFVYFASLCCLVIGDWWMETWFL